MATILIVDDRPVDRKLLVTLFGCSGHRMLEASDGEEALGLVQRERPDLVITDVLMPRMDGYELVRQLRLDSTISNTVVVFYSASYHDRDARALAQACGVDLILAKPTEHQVLLRAIEQALGEKAAEPRAMPGQFDWQHRRLLTDKLVQSTLGLEAANSRLAALINLGLELASETEPQRLIERCCRAGRELIGADRAVLAVFEDDGKTLRHFLSYGTSGGESVPAGSDLALDGMFSELPAGRRALRCRGLDEQRITLAGGPVRSFLGVPLVSPTSNYGWLCFVDKLGADSFSEDDEALAASLASQVAIAYENARRYEVIEQRTRELEQQIAEKEAALRIRDEFLSIAAHELKTPLTALLTASQLTLRELNRPGIDLPDQTGYLLRIIETQSRRLNRLVCHLLDVSRLEDRRMALNLEPADIARLVEEAAGAAQIKSSRHAVTVRGEEDLWAPVDPLRLEQVLVNLLDNAIKYSPDGGAVDVEVTRRDSSLIQIAVRDHGIGVPPESRDRLFERFGQAHAEDHRSGMGLGLYISRAIVELHGGQIVAEFPSDGGARFVITLPYCPSPIALGSISRSA